ncbi:hypothetical protein AVEN_208134-1, partial [Araneus ventricosus]
MEHYLNNMYCTHISVSVVEMTEIGAGTGGDPTISLEPTPVCFHDSTQYNFFLW